MNWLLLGRTKLMPSQLCAPPTIFFFFLLEFCRELRASPAHRGRSRGEKLQGLSDRKPLDLSSSCARKKTAWPLRPAGRKRNFNWKRSRNRCISSRKRTARWCKSWMASDSLSGACRRKTAGSSSSWLAQRDSHIVP